MKFKLIVILLFFPIAILSYIQRPLRAPFEAKPVFSLSKMEHLFQLFIEDLNGDGTDEIIKIIDNDYSILNGSNYLLTGDDTGNIKFLTIDSFTGTRTTFLQELNSTRKFSITNFIDIDGDDVKEIILNFFQKDKVTVCSYRWEEDRLDTIYQYSKEVPCRDRPWDTSPNVFAHYRGQDGQSLIYIAICTGFCRYPRKIIALHDRDGWSVKYEREFGAHMGSVEHFLSEDGAPRILLSASSTCNGAVAGGTADTCGYLILLNDSLKVLWSKKYNEKFCEVRGVTIPGKTGDHQNVVAFVAHQRRDKHSSVYLIDASSGVYMDSLLVTGFYASPLLVKNKDEEHGSEAVIAKDRFNNRLIKVYAIDKKLVYEFIDLSRFSTITHINTLRLKGKWEGDHILITDNKHNILWLTDTRLKPEVKFKLSGPPIRNQPPMGFRCADGNTRFVYQDGTHLIYANPVRTSLLSYAVRSYWGVILYIIVVGLYATYRKVHTPDTLEGQTKLLELIRVSAHHGELSIVSAISRIARLLEMLAVTKGQNLQVANQLRTALQVYQVKWAEDIKSIVDTAERYRLYEGSRRRLKQLFREIEQIVKESESVCKTISELHGHPDKSSDIAADRFNWTELLDKARKLKAVSKELSGELREILIDLDRQFSCNPLYTVKKVLRLFEQKLRSFGIELEVVLKEQAGEEKVITDTIVAEGKKTIEALSKEVSGVRIPEKELITILDNLLSNAVRAMEGSEKKKLTISVVVSKYTISIGIADTGCGIEPDLVSTIFQLGATTKKKGGTGLFYVKRTVERFGGAVDVRSDGSGKGAEFVVSIPRGS